MQRRSVVLTCILLFLCGIFFLTFLYGPLKRVYVSSGRVELASTSADIAAFWETTGVKGRTAVFFTRHLNAEESPDDTSSVKYADLAMKHGIIRAIYHVLPDNVWQGVSENLSRRENVRITPSGFVMIKPEGRVHIIPLSRFNSLDEKVLLVVEPGVWSSDESTRIARLISAGQIQSDLVSIIRGTTADADVFKHFMKASGS